jgi:hypothetical protein
VRARSWISLALSLSAPLAAQTPASGGVAARPVPGIQDNSFLLEEAYNQEPRVVQHISVLDVSARGGGAWTYFFTQEWPLFGQTHQLSYTVPVTHGEGAAGTGLDDVALNYRYQLVGSGETRVAVAPRVSAILPTGDPDRDRGAGAVGVQVNLPLSVELSERVVAHSNAGATYTPRARSALGERAATRDFNLGQSLIWLVSPTFNLLVEAAWSSSEEVVAPARRARSEAFVISPGLRTALNFPSGLQVVPGLAFPFGVGPSAGERRVIVYLSFEHGF